jgi:enamine deaminase RidA (YjgF/YER057c/UK114 family)
MKALVQRVNVGPRLSDVAIHKGVAYLAGQVPNTTRQQPIAAQVAEVLHIIELLLKECGSAKDQILSTLIFLRRTEDFSIMNEIWDAWVAAGAAPPRATMQANAMNPAIDVEIIVTAAVREQQ